MLELVMNGVPTFLAYLDTDLRFVYINKPHAVWYGLTEEEIIGKSLRELQPEDLFFRQLPYYQKVLHGEEVTFESQIRVRKQMDQVLSIRLVPHIRDEQVVGIFASLNDITDRLRTEATLMRTNKKLNLLSRITQA